MFFGMTTDGGQHGKGTIFKIQGDGTNYEEIHNFDQLTGANPKGALLLGNDGLLYGMTNRGGANDKGLVFRIYTDGTEYTSLKEFDENTGKWPLGHLIQASDNKLYGMTSIGGSLGNGTIFKINIDGTSFELLKDFSISKRPQGSLFEAEDGNLYGTTAIGGSDNAGTVFKLSKDGSDFEIIHDFIGNGGPGSINPYGDLIQATDGKLYGTTFWTFGGTIFSIHPDGSGFEQLYTFNNNGGGKPQGNLIEGVDSKLYGLTQEGGVNDLGSIFKI
ncbi:MAG: putative repeat protein (TIGR03803 family), partial [Cyclobacteriaceae bacterium]